MAANASTLLRDEVSSRRPAAEIDERTTTPTFTDVDEQWRQSLLDVMRQVIHALPDQTSLGELETQARLEG